MSFVQFDDPLAIDLVGGLPVGGLGFRLFAPFSGTVPIKGPITGETGGHITGASLGIHTTAATSGHATGATPDDHTTGATSGGGVTGDTC